VRSWILRFNAWYSAIHIVEQCLFLIVRFRKALDILDGSRTYFSSEVENLRSNIDERLVQSGIADRRSRWHSLKRHHQEEAAGKECPLHKPENRSKNPVCHTPDFEVPGRNFVHDRGKERDETEDAEETLRRSAGRRDPHVFRQKLGSVMHERLPEEKAQDDRTNTDELFHETVAKSEKRVKYER